jgi:hypothetical protein
MNRVILIVFVILFYPVISYTQNLESTSGCHCFNERTFNPNKKFAADNYLLTTSFNSFIAINFNLSKSQIVMMKMKGGIAPDLLLIALYISREGGVDLDVVLAVRENGGTWEQLVESSTIKATPQAKKVFAAIVATGENYAEGAEIVTDELLKRFFSMQEADILNLRNEKATGKELVLVNILAQKAKPDTSLKDIWLMHSIQKKSWGEIAQYFGFTPKETGMLLGNHLDS